MWTTCAFTYYMIMYQLKYWPGNIYINTIASAMSGNIAYIVAGFCYEKFGAKTTFSAGFLLSVVGGICLLIVGESVTIWMPVFVTIAAFGINGCFCLVYVIMVDVFPTLFVATAFGICNFAARIATIFAPVVAELSPPLPMILFTSMTLLGAVLIQFIRLTK